MRYIIEEVENGYILKCESLFPEDNRVMVFENNYKDEHQETAKRSLLWSLLEEFGNGSRYSKRRLAIKMVKGDKYEDSASSVENK